MQTRLFAPLALVVAAACTAPSAEPEARPADDGVGVVRDGPVAAGPAASTAPIGIPVQDGSDVEVDRAPVVIAQLPASVPPTVDPLLAIPVLPAATVEPPPSVTPEPVASAAPEPAPDPPKLVARPSPPPPPSPAPPPSKAEAPPAAKGKPSVAEPKPSVEEPKPSVRPTPSEPTAAGGQTQSARESLESRQRRVLALVQSGAKDAALRAEVDKLLDYRWLAASSLGSAKFYAERCAPRCDEFEDALTELIRRNYLARVRDSERGKVAYTGQELRKNGTLAKIDTTVSFKDGRGVRQSIAVDYVMHQTAAGWKVRDIITDGVGLAKTYRYDIKKMLAEGGIDLVIERLRKKIAEQGRQT